MKCSGSARVYKKVQSAELRAIGAHLEQLSGRRIKSRQDTSDYVRELSVKAAAGRSKSQHLKSLLLVALPLSHPPVSTTSSMFSFEILAQPTLALFVPVKGASPPVWPHI